MTTPDALTRAIEEMRAVCDAATPGPWDNWAEGRHGFDAILCDRQRQPIASIYQAGWDAKSRRGNREFLSAARTLLPRALAALSRAVEQRNRAISDPGHASEPDLVEWRSEDDAELLAILGGEAKEKDNG